MISADSGSFWGVFWVDVSSTSIAKSNFIALAKMLGFSVESIDDALQILANTKKTWLLILDNADDPEFDYQIYFPSGNQGAIIMTSRLSDCSGYNSVGSEALIGLDTEDSVQLLLKAAEIPPDLWPSCNRDAKHIVEVLGSHTLAIIQAGAYIARGHCLLDQYPEVYQQQRRRLLTFRPKQAQSRYSDVYATFEASAYVLELSKSEPARDALHLLDVLSMLHSSSIPIQIFEGAWKESQRVQEANHTDTNDLDDLSRWHVSQLPDFVTVGAEKWDSFRFHEASHLLVSLSLVTRDTQHGFLGLSMHPLTHAWARDRQSGKQQDQAWTTAGSVLALSYYDSQTWLRRERQLRAHVHSYLDTKIKTMFSCGPKPMILQILLKCSWILTDMRDDSRLAHLLEGIFGELKADSKCPSIELLPLYDVAARNLYNLGHMKQAVKLLEQIVKIRETSMAEDHPRRLSSQHVLAGAYLSNGQVQQAVKLLEQVVKIRETTLAEDHPARLASQHELARAYLSNRQVQQAVELLEQVVKIEETTLAEDHPSLLASKNLLTHIYQSNEQVERVCGNTTVPAAKRVRRD
jgi:hypothetical protein